ncbi:hypothetical protein M4I32_09380 [Microbacterium sp. LRZ72]|uniref:hypothetical protein n=1 Tax=Microbacterium sp. LRZ72 TaxID=2942481 RepID=UPI0029A4F61A|nr:hypothetical protein [Microbacterium sp. LRZ72]MDX2377008.1 hypothetical protein [Microbacterium sp. LRZ72]
MLKKTVSVGFVALITSALMWGATTAAHAQTDLGDYSDEVSVTVVPTVIAPGEDSVITFSEDYFEPGETVDVTVLGESADDAGLASLVHASSTMSTSKTAESDGGMVATFTAPNDGRGVYNVVFEGSRDYTAVITVVPTDVDVAADVVVGDTSLAGTGGGLSPVVVWVGLGALAAGVVAIVAGLLRRRSSN